MVSDTFGMVLPNVFAIVLPVTTLLCWHRELRRELVLLCVWLAPRLARWAIVVSASTTVLVAVTRMVLGVHWLTDTVGAVLGVLGVGLLTAAAVRLLPRPVPAATLRA